METYGGKLWSVGQTLKNMQNSIDFFGFEFINWLILFWSTRDFCRFSSSASQNMHELDFFNIWTRICEVSSNLLKFQHAWVLSKYQNIFLVIHFGDTHSYYFHQSVYFAPQNQLPIGWQRLQKSKERQQPASMNFDILWKPRLVYVDHVAFIKARSVITLRQFNIGPHAVHSCAQRAVWW